MTSGLSLPPGPQCERCARCLAVCPSYGGYLQETMGPRGRYELARALTAGELTAGPRARQVFSHCLQCMACKEACPKGVDVPAAVLAMRQALAPRHGLLHGLERRALAFGLRRRNTVARAGRFFSPLRKLFPKRPSGARHLPLMLPQTIAGRRLPRIAKQGIHDTRPQYCEAQAPVQGEVVLFTGCFFGLIDPAPAQAAIKALTHNGFAVRLPANQGCCGAPALYSGHPDLALEALERNLEPLLQFNPAGPLPVLTLCATCGNMLQNVSRKLAEADANLANRVAALADRIQDCCDFLATRPSLKRGEKLPSRVTIHDPCHLIRGMHVRDSVRTLLTAVPDLDLVEASTRTACCGGGGISGFKHPDQSERIGRERVQDLLDTQAQMVATACPGCLLQLRDQLSRRGGRMRAIHPLEILASSYS